MVTQDLNYHTEASPTTKALLYYDCVLVCGGLPCLADHHDIRLYVMPEGGEGEGEGQEKAS